MLQGSAAWGNAAITCRFMGLSAANAVHAARATAGLVFRALTMGDWIRYSSREITVDDDHVCGGQSYITNPDRWVSVRIPICWDRDI
jgi:hypothetical protein